MLYESEVQSFPSHSRSLKTAARVYPICYLGAGMIRRCRQRNGIPNRSAKPRESHACLIALASAGQCLSQHEQAAAFRPSTLLCFDTCITLRELPGTDIAHLTPGSGQQPPTMSGLEKALFNLKVGWRAIALLG